MLYMIPFHAMSFSFRACSCESHACSHSRSNSARTSHQDREIKWFCSCRPCQGCEKEWGPSPNMPSKIECSVVLRPDQIHTMNCQMRMLFWIPWLPEVDLAFYSSPLRTCCIWFHFMPCLIPSGPVLVKVTRVLTVGATVPGSPIKTEKSNGSAAAGHVRVVKKNGAPVPTCHPKSTVR